MSQTGGKDGGKWEGNGDAQFPHPHLSLRPTPSIGCASRLEPASLQYSRADVVKMGQQVKGIPQKASEDVCASLQQASLRCQLTE